MSTRVEQGAPEKLTPTEIHPRLKGANGDKAVNTSTVSQSLKEFRGCKPG